MNYGDRLQNLKQEIEEDQRQEPNLDIEIEAAMPQQQHIQESQQQFTQESQEMFEPNAYNSEQISGQSVQLQSNKDHKIDEGHTQDSIMKVYI